MARQFDVWRTSNGTLVTVIQNDLLDGLQTRVVAPLVPIGVVGHKIRNLNPVLSFGGEDYVLMPQLVAALTPVELGARAGSIQDQRDAIVRAIDTLLAGV